MKLVEVYGEMIERNAAKPNLVSETGMKGEQRDVGNILLPRPQKGPVPSVLNNLFGLSPAVVNGKNAKRST